MKHITSEYFEKIHQKVNEPQYDYLSTLSYDNIVLLENTTESTLNKVSTLLNSNDHCILQLEPQKDYDIDTISNLLTKHFGKPISFRNRKQLPYAKVQPEIETQHYVTSNWAQPLHTDEGHTRIYPQTLALFCAQPAENGGISLLVEFQSLYALLKERYGQETSVLFDDSCLLVSNVYGQEHKPLLTKDKTGKIGISYSSILNELYCSESVFEMYNFITNYVHNPDNQIRYKLQKNQILILDNTQVLHSRTAFNANSNRLLYRYWFTRCEL